MRADAVAMVARRRRSACRTGRAGSRRSSARCRPASARPRGRRRRRRPRSSSAPGSRRRRRCWRPTGSARRRRSWWCRRAAGCRRPPARHRVEPMRTSPKPPEKIDPRFVDLVAVVVFAFELDARADLRPLSSTVEPVKWISASLKTPSVLRSLPSSPSLSSSKIGHVGGAEEAADAELDAVGRHGGGRHHPGTEQSGASQQGYSFHRGTPSIWQGVEMPAETSP